MSYRFSPLRAADSRDREVFLGLRIVLHECDRRAAVLRCLASVRWLAMRGAEVVLVDGVAERASRDGTRAAVAQRFPGVHVADSRLSADFGELLRPYTAPLTLNRVDAAGPRWILRLAVDAEVERFRIESLLGELERQPRGTILVPGRLGTDGVTLPSAGTAALGGSISDLASGLDTWVARSEDLTEARAMGGLRWAAASASLVVSTASPLGSLASIEAGLHHAGA